MVEQFDIYWVDLDPTIGSEINKIRPCIVLSPNEMNNSLNTLIICPITSTIKHYPFRIKSKIENKKGEIAFDHIKSIDKSRVKNFIGTLDSETIQAVKQKMMEIFVE